MDKIKFYDLLEAAPDSILVVNDEGRIELINTAVEKNFRYVKEELIGQPIEILLPEKYRDNHKQDRKKYSAAPAVRPMGANLKLLGRRKDGSEFPVEISLSPVCRDTELYIIAIVRDVTLRELKELEIQKLNLELVNKARITGKSEVAESVLHSMGNAFNSLNVSIELVSDHLLSSKLNSKVKKLSSLFQENLDIWGKIASENPKLKIIPDYMIKLAEQAENEQAMIMEEIQKSISHMQEIRSIIASYQKHLSSLNIGEST